MVLRGRSEILVLLLNLCNGILIKLILSFPNFLTSRYCFLQYYKSFVLNKMGCFVYSGVRRCLWVFWCLWVYGKDLSEYRFRFSLLKYLELVFGPCYIL